MFNAITFPILVALLIIISGLGIGKLMLGVVVGNNKAGSLAEAIWSGVRIYLVNHYKILAIVAGLIFLVIGVTPIGWATALAFLWGMMFSLLAGLASIKIFLHTYNQAMEIGHQGIGQAFKIAMRSGLVVGFLAAGLALLGVSSAYIFWGQNNLFILIGLSLGSSLVSVFARWGGGIYSKAVEIGISLIKRTEMNAKQTDSDYLIITTGSIGDSTGVTADLFETYTIVLTASVILGGLIFGAFPNATIYPLVLSGAGIFVSLFSSWFIKLRGRQSIGAAFYQGLGIVGVLTGVVFYFVTDNMMVGNGIYSTKALFETTVIGLATAGALVATAWYYTFVVAKLNNVKNKIASIDQGARVISGFLAIINLTIWPVLIIVAAILGSYYLASLYGLAMAGVAMLSLFGTMLAINIYTLVIDKVASIAKISETPTQTRDIISLLNNTKDTTKVMVGSYTIGSAVWAALLLFIVYLQEFAARNQQISFSFNDSRQHLLMVGIFLGGVVCCLFVGLFVKAVAVTIKKIHYQFNEVEVTINEEQRLDYLKTTDTIAKLALKQMVVRLLILLAAPVLVGFIFGPEALAGLLVGSILLGLFGGSLIIIGGMVWNRVKEYKRADSRDENSSLVNKEYVSGDVVLNIRPDVIGSGLGVLMKILGVISLLIVAFLI